MFPMRIPAPRLRWWLPSATAVADPIDLLTNDADRLAFEELRTRRLALLGRPGEGLLRAACDFVIDSRRGEPAVDGEAKLDDCHEVKVADLRPEPLDLAQNFESLGRAVDPTDDSFEHHQA